MSSIFVPSDAAMFVMRLEKLTPVSQRKWGTMSVSQMLTHIQLPIKVALGEMEPKRSIGFLLFGGLLKKRIINHKPFNKELPTDPSFVVKHDCNFDSEKRNAIELIQRLSSAELVQIQNRKHPIFGKLTAEEWDVLTVKHLDHHLRQFGV
jgi:hypothetical protein